MEARGREGLSPTSGGSILVVDDEPLVTLAVAKVLAGEGFDVIVANDGAEALERIRERRPSLIVLDLQMPILDGYGFISACRGRPDCLTIPIIVATGAEDIAIARQRLEGDDGIEFMAKPFDLDTLLSAVERLRLKAAR